MGFEIKGKYATATVFTDNAEQEACAQIVQLLNMPYAKDSQPRFMPDVHAGKGCTIGTTMKVRDKVCPNLVGVDIGCGMLAVEVGDAVTDLALFDRCVHEQVPAGFDTHEECSKEMEAALKEAGLDDLRCLAGLKLAEKYEHVRRSMSSLGGGNHFIELDEKDDGGRLLVVHSGSRYLGLFVAGHYQALAEASTRSKAARGDEDARSIPKALCYLEGNDLEDYLHDVDVCQKYAAYSRRLIAEHVLSAYLGGQVRVVGIDCSWAPGHARTFEGWETIHNYIDLGDMVLRKGAIACHKDQKVLIPLNMRDGSVICIGKGNPDWNMSGPHGAGRVMSRSQAKREISMEEYAASMTGIYSSTVNPETLDEAPQAYKPAAEILENIRPTADIVDVVKPVYNFKAAEKRKGGRP